MAENWVLLGNLGLMSRMGTRVVLFRAVNVGGTAKLPMAELRVLAADVGATDVQTYIQSGNLVCVPPGDPEQFDRALEKTIEERYGFFREAISRSPAELKSALKAHPFEILEPKYSYVTFLTGPPTAEAIAKARTYECGGDVWEVIGRTSTSATRAVRGDPRCRRRPSGRRYAFRARLAISTPYEDSSPSLADPRTHEVTGWGHDR